MSLRGFYNKKGVAVILIVGVLAILTIMAVAFAVSIRFELLFAKSSINSLKAKYLTEAGINKAIIEVINDSESEFIDELSDNWCSVDSSNIKFSDNTLLNNTGKYDVYVFDCQRMVNINSANSNLLVNLPGIDNVLAASIIAARPFETKEEIKRAPGIGETKYNNLKDLITVNSWQDPACNNRSPINVNTASEDVIKAVLSGAGVSDVNAAYNIIVNARPFSGWNEFDNCIDSTGLSFANRQIIKDNANPNREKPTNYTTEFCFNSGGYYEIHSTGTLYETSSQSVVSAQKGITAIVHTYNILNKTTKADFNEDLNYNGILDVANGDIDADGDGDLDVPIAYEKVNWQDGCPVNSNDDNGLNYANNYEKIPGSIKLGFWDNFDEDNDNVAKEGWSWYSWRNESAAYPMNISDADSDGDDEMWGNVGAWGCYSKFVLREDLGWIFGDEFSIRVHANDLTDLDGRDNNAMVEFNWGGALKAKLEINPYGFLYDASGRTDITLPPPFWKPTVEIDPDSDPREGKDWFDSKICLYLWDGKTQDRLHNIGTTFYGISECTNDHYTNKNWLNDMNKDEWHGVTPESATLKLVVSSAYGSPNYRVSAAVGQAWHRYYNYNNGWSISSKGFNALTDDYIPALLYLDSSLDNFDRYDYWMARHNGSNFWNTTQWRLILYQNHAQPKWDEVRIISPDGYYESPWYDVPEGQVLWGTVSWTETIPSTANSTSEIVLVQIATNSGLSLVSNGDSIGTTSSRFRFKVNLTTNDADYSETPVFEDITLTYFLPRVETNYWSMK